jgi:hypothetical protein
MSCKFCTASKQSEFPAEINIHPPRGIENLDKPAVWCFPSLLICLNCGFTEFVLAATELSNLSQNYPEIGKASGGALGT